MRYSQKILIGSGVSKSRAVVHNKGFWHHTIQANIVRTARNGGLEILVQKRSDLVDISKGKYDQSLATQMIPTDKSYKQALIRGLLEELGIQEKEIVYTEFLPKAKLKIVKKYKEDRRLYNREILHLFLVKIKKQRKILPVSSKVDSVAWIKWKTLAQNMRKRPNKFTKTLRLYILYKKIRLSLEKATENFLQGQPHKTEGSGISITYFSYAKGKDIIKASFS